MRVIRFGIRTQNAAQESSSNSAVRNLDNQLRTRRKVAKMLIAVVIMFFINYFPVYFFPVLQVSLSLRFWSSLDPLLYPAHPFNYCVLGR